eukprot:CAMPEP_0113531926 /NCGR_PEP_ID=MMETSP0015_2-20120614/3766_1 /TAXON_ID=2838 /ORGANISM="Odontella" /LENGTH=178 /DNA_ID=CAMNT_0000430813 /DNA_START=160 /DNA_END=693 /DNA_ORIENTATION=+ /assembly_acc=CAM_ASM_000160
MKWFEPSSFDWGDKPPLSSFQSVKNASFFYVILVVFSTKISRAFLPAAPDKKDDDHTGARTTGLQWKPWFGTDLNSAQFVHNVNLVISSAIMLAGVLIESYRRITDEGGLSWPPFLLCEVVDSTPAKGALYYWSYIYYLSKYYELLDTALQLARGKPPPHFFLHVYHHAVVLFMAWAW